MNFWNIASSFPKHHVPITPSDSTPLSRRMIIVALTDGNVELTDKDGTTITYAVVAGWNSPVIAEYVKEGTDATVIGVY